MENQKQQNTQQQVNDRDSQGIQEQKIAENPNPRANENIPSSNEDAGPDRSDAEEVGSEITDGEDA